VLPISPVYEPSEEMWGVKEVVVAKDHPTYAPLPLISFGDGMIVTRWGLSWRERLSVLFGGSVWLTLLTGGGIPPMKMHANGLDACAMTMVPRKDEKDGE
jgi:hypothetical protein